MVVLRTWMMVVTEMMTKTEQPWHVLLEGRLEMRDRHNGIVNGVIENWLDVLHLSKRRGVWEAISFEIPRELAIQIWLREYLGL